jgi:acyl carrier protein
VAGTHRTFAAGDGSGELRETDGGAMSGLQQEVVALIEELCYPEKPDLTNQDRPLLEAGLDSLDFASMLMAVEDKYGVKIEDKDIPRLRTLRDLVGYLERRPQQ